jgi:tetratricopeptide (TPR) repeat protein
LPPEKKRSPEAVTLLTLRWARGWPTKRLADALGFADDRLIARYERGDKPFSRASFDRLTAGLGYDPETVEALLSAHRRLLFPPAEEDPSPVALRPEQRAAVERAALAAGWTFTEELRVDMARRERRKNAEAARREAARLWEPLKAAPHKKRRDLVEIHPELRSWALAEHVSHESERAAAHRVTEALELADLALRIAGRVPGKAAWRSRLQGYAWAYLANARRVGNDFDGADKAFTKAWELWRVETDAVSNHLLPEWRLLDLEASLRREQQRFSEALTLLDQAGALCGGSKVAARNILLQKEHILSQMGDFKGALAVLDEAAPLVERSGEPRLLFGLQFNRTDNFVHLGLYSEAAELLPEVRRLAIQQANELDLVRVLWLEAKIHAGQGKKEMAIAALEQVQREFTVHKLPYDAALSSLDLALLWLEEGRKIEVRALALGMAWIFTSQKIHREALAALRLFYEAARQETATVELTQCVITAIEEARRSAPRPQARGRG